MLAAPGAAESHMPSSRRKLATRSAGIARMLELLRAVDVGGATPDALRRKLRVGIATVYRLRLELQALGVRIEWDEDRSEYIVADWGVLDRARVLERIAHGSAASGA